MVKVESTLNRSNKLLSGWLLSLCLLIIIMVVFGGFVRLTRSGLSIVEWEVVTGVIPPIGETAWQATFAKYQQSPEYQHINSQMTLEEYKFIYYAEYFHRLLGRITGLMLVIPLAIFLWRKIIPLQKAPIYLGVAVLFALQGVMGWYMVQSGLVDQPNVSHYRLTAHLILALTLFACCFWLALNKLDFALDSVPQSDQRVVLGLSFGVITAIVIQIIYGGFMAGLKAGYISNTFPLMFGALVPPGLLSALQPWPINLVADALTVHFIHRWLAFLVLALIGLLYFRVRKKGYGPKIQQSTLILFLWGGTQVLLGISVIFWHVPILLALLHQTIALGLFALAMLVNHQLWQS